MKLVLLQYPHTGRTSCIVRGASRNAKKRSIAVPSHGSNFMHLIGHHDGAQVEVRIAVPSHGSNFMHREQGFRHAQAALELQYPHTGRTSCIGG